MIIENFRFKMPFHLFKKIARRQNILFYFIDLLGNKFSFLSLIMKPEIQLMEDIIII